MKAQNGSRCIRRMSWISVWPRQGGAEIGDTLVSVTGKVMGTLAYMSPEKASGRPDEVDMRSRH